MTELKLVQAALANLPRPTPPPRLHRAVRAQVRAEAQAEATASQVRTWSRTEADGWTTERWEGARLPEEKGLPPASAHTTGTYWRQDETGRTTIYEFTQTY